MKRSTRAVGFAATAACLLSLSAAACAASSAADQAAAGAARTDHRSAVAGCDRMHGAAQRDCLHDAAMIRALDLSFPPPTDGAAGGESPALPGKWMLPGAERLPDNLASNASR